MSEKTIEIKESLIREAIKDTMVGYRSGCIVTEVTKKEYYVVAVDKSMSGWGKAEGGRSVVIVVCHDNVQADYCKRALEGAPEMTRVAVYPYKPSIRAAHVQEYDFLDSTAWNRDYMVAHGGVNEAIDLGYAQRRYKSEYIDRKFLFAVDVLEYYNIDIDKCFESQRTLNLSDYVNEPFYDEIRKQLVSFGWNDRGDGYFVVVVPKKEIDTPENRQKQVDREKRQKMGHDSMLHRFARRPANSYDGGVMRNNGKQFGCFGPYEAAGKTDKELYSVKSWNNFYRVQREDK